MKHFKFLLLALLTVQFVEALNTNITMPESVQIKLCQELSEEGCSIDEQLTVSNYFKLDNDKLLLFFYLYKPKDMYRHGYINIPVIVDTAGRWQIIDTHMDAEIQDIGRDPQGGIWVRTLWKIEGVAPALYYSKNGTEWSTVSLPLDRHVNSSFEDLGVCFLEKKIQLTFNSVGGDGVVKAWKTSYADAITKKPLWDRIPTDDMYLPSCFKTSAYNNAWEDKGKRPNLDLFFVHKYKTLQISIGKYIPKKVVAPKKAVVVTQKPILQKKTNSTETIYTIQVGTFNYPSSLESMKKVMKNMKYPLIDREFKTTQSTKYKLFLGSFKEKILAQRALIELRINHPDNKFLTNAFVLELP